MSKTILITGATDGIGRLTAQRLAEQGHQVLLHGRNAEKLQNAAAEIGPGTKTYLADLSNLDEVRSMAASLRQHHPTIDVLINNAGILRATNTKAASGRDVRFDVNTIAPYILTRALLPIIPTDGRIINLSSAAQAPVDIAALEGKRDLDHMDTYAQSKLAITIWSEALANELPNGPSVVSVNPGSLLATKMVKEGFGIAGNDLNVGADILVDAALSEEFSTMSGQYYDNDAGRFASPHAAAQNSAHTKRVMHAISQIADKQ